MPTPGSLQTSISPSRRRGVLERDREPEHRVPRPARERSALKKRSKRCGRSSRAIPGPRSETSTNGPIPSRATRTGNVTAAVLEGAADQVGDNALEASGSLVITTSSVSRRRRSLQLRGAHRGGDEQRGRPAPAARAACPHRAGRLTRSSTRSRRRLTSATSSLAGRQLGGMRSMCSARRDASLTTAEQGAQLVRDVGREAPLAGLRLRELVDLRLERVGHLVERRRPGAELVLALDREPRVEEASASDRAVLARATGASMRRASSSPARAAKTITTPEPGEQDAQLGQLVPELLLGEEEVRSGPRCCIALR